MLIFVLIMNVSVFAAPDTVAADAASTAHDLIVITNPQNQKDSTFDPSYIVSGYGCEGATVTLYRLNESENVYKKIFNAAVYVDASGASQTAYKEATVTIGASGLFMNTISLNQGANHILVRAEHGGKVQLMKLSVTKYNYSLFDIIKALTN